MSKKPLAHQMDTAIVSLITNSILYADTGIEGLFFRKIAFERMGEAEAKIRELAGDTEERWLAEFHNDRNRP